MNELKKRLFLNARGDSIVLLPGESATGSTWIRQSKDESATLVQLFIKLGDTPRRLVQLRLADMPKRISVKPESEPISTAANVETVPRQ